MGDVLLDRGVRKEINRSGGVNKLFSGVENVFKQADAVVINLECPLTEKETPINKKFIFRGDSAWAKNLREVGVTHAALANNHSMDQGRSGLIDTYLNLEKENIQTIGYGNTQVEACDPIIIEKGKQKVAIFNSVLVPLENWMYLEQKQGICQASVIELCERIKETKTQQVATHIVVVLHWGAEYHLTPDLSQRKAARQLINSGADALIGHHPHVIQQEEIYKGKPIFYSLGNFVFDQTKPNTDIALIVSLIFDGYELSFSTQKAQIKNCQPVLISE